MVDLDEAPPLEKNHKHTIEVVVDRFKVNQNNSLRLAESFETALALSDGIAVITHLDEEKPEQLFSAKFSCPICNYSLDELEPKLFSFNNPVGACKTCDGLGKHQFFDVDRIVQHPTVSISEGAIRGWDRRTLFYYNMLSSLAQHYDINLAHPWENLPKPWPQRI